MRWSTSLLASGMLSLAHSKLVVQSPPELAAKFSYIGESSTILANYANFGHIPYGQSLVGTV
jgi:hypothetical protein